MTHFPLKMRCSATFTEFIFSMSVSEKDEKYLLGKKTLRIRVGESRMLRMMVVPYLVSIRFALVNEYLRLTCKEPMFTEWLESTSLNFRARSSVMKRISVK